MMTPPPKILELVQRFQDNLDAYRAGHYNETQVRREFIDPFLKTLGWDVDNEQGYAEQYKQVVHEDAIRVGGATKAPDYGCRIGGQRKFFAEAKKPSVNIKEDVHPAYQLRRYAWSAKLPLSILTDFEEFAVYDCRVKPDKGDSAAQARILYMRFDEYPARWGEIAAIFSPDAIRKGSFDRFVESKRSKRGTAEVDAAFLAEISDWRDELARNIALRNKERGLKSRQLAHAVQSTIDRLIFLRIAEDRGIEPYGRLRDIAAGKEIYSELADLFRLADARYNSGLFHFKEEKGRDSDSLDTFTLSLTIDDKVLRNIIRRLYYPDSPYQFDVIPADILGQVYEQFLGKVIRLTVKGQAKIEEKPEVKKAGGVYYTPTYIVDYIVRETVGQLLAGKSASPTGASKGSAALRILDPACGSGSFLLGAYQFLLDWHLSQYSLEPDKWLKGRSPTLFELGAGGYGLTINERKRILLDHIFRVDIDPQAVEVTKLSLLLKVLDGESAQSLNAQLRLLPERALPDLGGNIKCGNSLIGPDFYENRQLSLGLPDEEELYRVNAFDWAVAFPQIVPWGGFDAVIGNPPYIRIQALKEWAPQEVEFYKQRYKSASKGNYDIYVVFVEKGLQLLNKNGLLGYILPHKFFNAQYGEPLREIISQGNNLSKIVHFGSQQIFDSATTYTCLLFLSGKQNAEFEFVQVDDLTTWRSSNDTPNYFVPYSKVGIGEWNFVTGQKAELFERLISYPTQLGSVASIFVGLQTSSDEIYVLEEVERIQADLVKVKDSTGQFWELETGALKPFLKNFTVSGYIRPTFQHWLIFPYQISENNTITLIPPDKMAELYPGVWKYLKANEKDLRQREKGKANHDGWYGYIYRKNLTLFDAPKLIVQVISLIGRYAYDPTAIYFSGGGNAPYYGVRWLDSQSHHSIHYLRALLNSPVLDFVMHRISTSFRGGYWSYSKRYLEKLPIRLIDFAIPSEKELHDQVVALVKQMLELHQQLAAARMPHEKTILQRQIAAADRQINALVYQLYALTAVEIALVEAA
jgi:predicted type IV restriction endonuclease